MSHYFEKARAVFRNLFRAGNLARTTGSPTRPAPAGGQPAVAGKSVSFVDAARAAAEPASWIDTFDAAVAQNLPVSDGSLAIIRQHVGRYPPEAFFPTDRERQGLLRFLRPRPGLSARLTEMHECGLLGAMFPEFRSISGRVMREVSHTYAVDTHTLLAIQQLERLLEQTTLSGERFGSMLRELNAPELLVLSLLLHDVGKSKNENHVEEGVRMAQTALDRLQLAGDERQTVEFLIRNQLMMSRVAFHGDAADPDVVRHFASLFSSEEHLKMLCLMTLADLGAMHPDTLTPWKEELLWRLFVDTYNQMTMGYGDEVIVESEAALASIQASRPGDIPEAEMARFLEGLPRRYLTLFDSDTIYRHVRLWRDIGPDDVHYFLKKKEDLWELTVETLDKAYLFSNICGVLAYFGLDILRGHALTGVGSLALDVFDFADRDGFFQTDGQHAQFTRLLSDVVAGRTDITSLLQQKQQGVSHRRTPPVIYFDNDYSSRYTVLELVADDATGLLHRISRVISRHGCGIDLVLISTEGQKAVDVFHLRKGTVKLGDSDQLALTADLEHVLEGGALSEDPTGRDPRATQRLPDTI
jgi:[protein-PII] uridylyltransferase